MTETAPASDTQPLPSPPQPSPPPVARRSASPFLFVILLFLVIAAAAGGYYLWREQTQKQAELAELRQQVEQSQAQQTRLERELRTQVEQQLATSQTAITERADGLQSRLAELEQTQQQLQQQLEGQQQRLQALSTTSREDWLLAEAEYLLKVANQRVLLERDPRNALALMRSADELIQQTTAGTGDAELFAVRKTLSRDIAALERVTPVDKEGLYLRLYALADALDELPRVAPTEFVAPAPSGESEVTAEPQSWSTRLWRELKSMAGALHNYIKIDDVQAPAKPLVDSYMVQLAGLNVRLLLEQAQLAVLEEDATVYQHSLQQAQTLVDDYYLQSPQSQQLMQSIAELAAIDIAPELPDIAEPLQQLHEYLRLQHQARPAPRGQL